MDQKRDNSNMWNKLKEQKVWEYLMLVFLNTSFTMPTFTQNNSLIVFFSLLSFKLDLVVVQGFLKGINPNLKGNMQSASKQFSTTVMHCETFVAGNNL